MPATDSAPVPTAPLTIRKHDGEVLSFLGVRMRFVLGPQQTAGRWSLMEHVLEAGAGPGPHRHPWDEAYFVIEGELQFRLGDVTHAVGQGEVVFAPAGVVHGFQATAATRVLIFDLPAHSDAFFRDVAREITEMPRDVPKLIAVGERHGVEFLAP